ncbi:thioesterase II family protein [Streptomyces yunnanensis]|uniref:Surfactin synthase thioesterase subunit n=1 Tax=Streptomyces yunnanensis TaxID=156453 RepID=A0A9X8QWT7_9ACTN|nr:thioesterase domain-containing protein [Streptomyces yunnanensis]SHM72321.1 Surfactin synthase thioesterase subunit [Streptomyces yunnanensis]
MTPSTDWIRLGPEPVLPRLHLLCFPHAGGSAAGCLNWAAAAPPGVRLAAVQPPGRDSRVTEPPLRSARAVAEALGPALADRGDTVPWAFFGHSLGALLAFETAHWLLRRGLPGPRILVVASAPAPHLPRSSPPLHHLPGPDLLKALDHLGGLPPSLANNPRLARLWLPRIRTDLEIYDTYVPRRRVPLPCPITAFAAPEDRLVPVAEVAQWHHHTAGHWSLRISPGDHFFVHADPAPVLAAALAEEARPP